MVVMGSAHVHAQTALVLDGSLPNGRTDDLTATQAGPLYVIDEAMGEARGGNLFHSFQDFSIGAGDTAQFSAGNPFDRVLVRITGGDPTSIGGTLRSTVMRGSGGGADLFLLNPSGILIGNGASLDLPGSLYLSTAHTLGFDDASVLDLTNAAGPVLSMAAPESFGFLGGTPAAEISLTEDTGSGALSLSLAPGETLAAIGGQIRTEGTPTSSVDVLTTGGRVGLVATGSAAANVDSNTLEITTTTPQLLGRVRVASNAFLNGLDFADGNADQGQLVIRGGRLEMSNFAVAEFSGNAGSDKAIDIVVDEAILVEQTSFLVVGTQGANAGGRAHLDASRVEIRDSGSGLFSGSVGTGGGADIEVHADALVVEDGATIESRGGAGSPSGSIQLDVAEIDVDTNSTLLLLQDDSSSPPPTLRLGAGNGIGRVRIANGGLILSQTRASGNGAAMEIATGQLEVVDGGVIESSTIAGASGDAGDISIGADEIIVSRSNPSETPGFIATASQQNSLGDGGDVHITTNTLLVESGGQISTTTAGRNAGSIDIDASVEVVLRGDDGATTPAGLLSRATVTSNGSGGTIDVRAPRILLEDGATISSLSESVGGAGSITLDADESIVIRGAGTIGSLVSSQTRQGLGGDIDLRAPLVRVENGGAVDLTTRSTQSGGLLRIEADELVVAGSDPSGVNFATLAAISENSGDAQGIEIDVTGRVAIRDGGLVTTRAEASGLAGNIRITAGDVAIERGGQVETQALAPSTANAGNVTIDAARTLTIDANGSRITTDAAIALGGNIELRAGNRVTLTRSEISASVGSGAGNGGNVTIETPLLIQNGAAVSATAAFGNGGNITYTVPLFVESADANRDATSIAGVDGEISSSVPAEDLSGQVVALDTKLVDAADRLTQDCAQRDERAGSFVVRNEADVRRFDADDLDFGVGDGDQSATDRTSRGAGSCGAR